MKSTEMLMHEHRIIERMLNILSNYCTKIERGKEVSPENLQKCVDFLMVFADKCHHLKEENVLFVEMEAHGIAPDTGPTAVMLAEHEIGRRYVRGMANAVENYAKGDANKAFIDNVDNARAYIGLLTQHIQKEDNMLYPMANELLGDMDDDLVEKFENREKQLGIGIHEKYMQIVEQLEKDSSL